MLCIAMLRKRVMDILRPLRPRCGTLGLQSLNPGPQSAGLLVTGQKHCLHGLSDVLIRLLAPWKFGITARLFASGFYNIILRPVTNGLLDTCFGCSYL